MRTAVAFLVFLGIAPAAEAMEFGYSGYVDLRAVAPSDQRSWLDGGLGKFRFGKGDSNFRFAEAVGEGDVSLAPELSAVASVRASPGQRVPVDVLEAFVRYAPITKAKWRWSVKAGAFFPPFSLENIDTGWSSYWTLTPSAIDSWYGDELRTLGGEGTLEWHGDAGTLTMSAAAFGWNDPAGVMMADRGFTMDDRPTGLFDHLRVPDATVILSGDTPPDTTPIFKEIDHRVGWYAGASWDSVSWDGARAWHLEVERYDNDGNASAHDGEYFAWATRFWAAGAFVHAGRFTATAQALSGDTTISPLAGFSSVTDFDAAYAMLGWERGEWRLAARYDIFHTRTHTTLGPSLLGENGSAFTAAVSYLPTEWLKLTGEVISLDSTRPERLVVGVAPQRRETQFQLSARFLFNG